MSKGNRVKGVYNELFNMRMCSPSREQGIESRKDKVAGRVYNELPTRPLKLTKTQRKLMRSQPAGTHEQHPLARKATAMERGAAYMMSFMTSHIYAGTHG